MSRLSRLNYRKYRRNFDSSRLISLRSNPDNDSLEKHVRSKNLADQAKEQLKSGNKQKARELYLEASKWEEQAFNLTSFDHPRTRGILAISTIVLSYKAKDKERVKTLISKFLSIELPYFARAKLMVFKDKKKNPIRKYRSIYVRNPDPDGAEWGPTLYNPLKDKNHAFKDESHYYEMISKLRRNPSFRRNFLYFRRKK